MQQDIEARRISEIGFDACTLSRTNGRGIKLKGLRERLSRLIGLQAASRLYQNVLRQPFHVYDYEDVLPFPDLPQPQPLRMTRRAVCSSDLPWVMPGWDNTPRTGVNGHVFLNPTPARFQDHLRQAIVRVQGYPQEHQFVILKSWNEWAEGNTLEPDLRYGTAFLKAISREISQWE
jgi:hypothetical protein